MTAQALRHFTSIAAQAQAQCDKFAEKFAKDPAHALSWGTDVFKQAALLKVAQMLVYGFAPPDGSAACTLQAAYDTCMSRIISRAQYPAQSTSPTSNLMEQYEAAAYAEAVEYLKYQINK